MFNYSHFFFHKKGSDNYKDKRLAKFPRKFQISILKSANDALMVTMSQYYTFMA